MSDVTLIFILFLLLSLVLLFARLQAIKVQKRMYHWPLEKARGQYKKPNWYIRTFTWEWIAPRKIKGQKYATMEGQENYKIFSWY